MALSRAQEAAAVILLASGAGEISLAGGAGLLTHGVIDRDTEDLDAFTRHMSTSTHELADRVRGAFERANYRVVDDSAYPEATLRRLLVTPRTASRARAGRKPETVKVEIGQDFQALPAIATPIGPVLDPLELGANKILTIYNVTRARDGDDLARLAARYRLDQILDVADRKETEPLDRTILADQMSMFTRLPAAEFPWLTGDQATAITTYMCTVAEHLRAALPLDTVPNPYAHSAEAPPQRPGNDRTRAVAKYFRTATTTHRATPSSQPPRRTPPPAGPDRGRDR